MNPDSDPGISQDDARAIMSLLISAWGGPDDLTAMGRAVAIIAPTEPKWAFDRGVRQSVLQWMDDCAEEENETRAAHQWLDGKLEASDETLAVIAAMQRALQ